MAQDRKLLQADAHWCVERVHSHAVDPAWSPVYCAPSQRWVLPFDSGTLELRSGGRSTWADALTALQLAPAQRYQLRPQARHARHSMVVSVASGDTDAPGREAIGWLLSPRLLYRLRLHWRRLASGLDALDATSRLVADAVAVGGSADAAGAVGRARRCLGIEEGQGMCALSMHELGEAVGSSPFHLARVFRARTGLSPHQYRLHLRLAAALARLDDGERDLAGLAYDLGFSSQSHLGALFRREIGVAPGEARRALASAAG